MPILGNDGILASLWDGTLQGEEAAVDSTALALRPGRSWSAAVGPWAPPKTAIPAPCPMGGRLRGQCRRMWGMGRWRIA